MIRTNRSIALAKDENGQETIIGRPSGNEELSYQSLSSALPGLGLPPGSNVTNIATPGMVLPLLDGFIPETHTPILNRMYRECYYNDPVVSSAINLLSTFPFGDFSLSGISEERKLKKYAASVEALRLRNLFPTLSVDYLVLGKFVATLGWNEKEKFYNTISPHNIDFIQFEDVPAYGVDPVMKLHIPKEIIQLLSDKRPEARRVIERLPRQLREGSALAKEGITLNPDDTLHIARQAMVSDYQGSSILKSVLPIWLIEKALIRGTLDSVWRRQRALMQITVGDDLWEPTMEDMQSVLGAFQAADHDPVGAFVITRQSVNVQEYRRGDDFFKWPDIYEWAMRAKMQGLGISESFITGDATLSAAQGVISVTMQYFAAYRNKITRAVFYDKVFPAIAIANGYTKKSGGMVVLGSDGSPESRGYREGDESPFRNSVLDGLVAEFASTHPSKMYEKDLSNYVMPKVQWHDSLKPDTTTEFQELLDRLSQHGVPIPLRMWAASAGVSLDQIVDQQKSDMKIRKSLEPWLRMISQNTQIGSPYVGDSDDTLGEDGSGDGQYSSDGGDTVEASHLIPGMGSVPRRALLDTNFEGAGLEPREETGGRTRVPSKQRQRQIDEKVNKLIAHAAAEAVQTENKKENARYTRKRNYSYSRQKM